MNFVEDRNFLHTELYTLTILKFYKVHGNGMTWLQESSNTFHNNNNGTVFQGFCYKFSTTELNVVSAILVHK